MDESARPKDPEEVTVFDHYCTTCQKRSLVFPSQIVSLVNTEHGIEVAFTCWCGADQTWVTGRRRTARVDVLSAA